MEELGELKTGVGRAILTADRDPAQIAVLHSQRSLHVVGSAHWRDNTTAVCETLKDLGLQFDFVADQDLPSGALSEQPYKVLFLPMAVALSNDEASAIEAFAQNGGRAIAVGDVGVYDRFGALRSKGALDDLFGISRTSQPYAGTQDSAQASMNLYGVDLDVPPAGVLLNQGQGTFEGLGVRPLSSRAVGEGQAIFLNFLWSPYRSFQSGGIGGEIVYRHSSDAATARAFWRVMEELLKGTGIERPVRVLRDGQPVHNIEQVVYRRGAITYLGLLPRYYGGRYTKETERNLIKDENYVDVELILGNASDYVYDVRQRKSLGQIQALKTKVTNGVALLYALTPYAIEGLELSAPSSAQPGDTLDISAHVAANTEDALGDHVVHMKLVMPDGKVADWASHNLLTQRGTGRWQPQLALNALPGIWRVEAQELVSGKTAFKEIVVHPE